jgi:glycosyltransferase involved in cell wall biosynthesis
LPYTNDNLPQIGLEAQSCGLPIVSFDIDGINEITENKKTGYLSKIISSQGLAEGITWLAKKKKILFQKNSINRAKKKWNKEIVLKKYNNLYKQVLKST